ncbi:hypothetical protein [Methanolapillus ohkumae]|uniref:Uncharacterized protein n=1 Tax=Methanolapillus ohkumae TaxID=3028298 RepID=A0AA96ZY63_9EURY|nr:hypothetical protein MsAm2_16310 [Methanosarcinaceae archaeon Am2]
MNFLILSTLLISLIPGIYFSTKKNFLIAYSERYNVFWIKLIYTTPAFSMTIFLLSAYAFVLEPNYFVSPENIEMTQGILSFIISIIISLLFILIVNKFMIKNDKELQIDKEMESKEYDLYVCCQNQKYRNFGGKKDGTKFSYPKRKGRELLVGTQMEDMIIDFKKLKGIDYALTHNGEIIVSEKALNILHKNNLSGFQVRSVRNKKSKMIVEEKYFQLLATQLMPPTMPETKIYDMLYLMGNEVLVDDLVYYYQSEVSNVLDFNSTFEYFGNEGNIPYLPQRFWIITKKARDILILELNQEFDDFKPVILVGQNEVTSKSMARPI